MSNIKTNDATSKSAGAISTTGTGKGNTNGTTELKAQLNVVKAQKKELTAQLKECERQEKSLQKQLAPQQKKNKTTASTKASKKKKTGRK